MNRQLTNFQDTLNAFEPGDTFRADPSATGQNQSSTNQVESLPFFKQAANGSLAAPEFQFTSSPTGEPPKQLTAQESATDRAFVPPQDAVSNYRAELLDFTTPFISVNDGLGAAGSRAFAEPLDAVVSIQDQNGNFCTGALIAPNVVLSARHCEISGSHEVVFGSNLANPSFSVGVQSVTEIGEPGNTIIDGDDIALVFLESNVPASVATPLPLTAQTGSLVGSTATIAGYGDNGTGSSGDVTSADGFRWGGQNVIDHFGEFAGASNLFLADFDDGSENSNSLGGLNSNAIPLEFEAIVTPGDSGGPLLVEQNGELTVAGVTTGGLVISGLFGGFAYWTGIGNFQQQIENAGGVFVAGSTSGDDGELPPQDDHSNSIQLQTTNFEFTESGSNLLARDNGNVGFGNNSMEDQDVFRFVTSSQGRFIVDARSRSDGFDPFLRVFDSEGILVGQNNNSNNPNLSNPVDSQLTLTNVDAGEYFVVVSGANSTTGNYSVAVRTNSSIASELDSNGDTFGDATQLTLSPTSPTTFVNASVETAIDRDFYRFVAQNDGRIVARTQTLSGNLNPVLRALNENRELLDANNNFGGSLDSRVDFDVQAGEAYAIRINSVGTTSGDYRISLRFIGETGCLDVFRNNLASPDSDLNAGRLGPNSGGATGLLASV